MHNQLIQLGRIFQKTREEKNLTLKEAENATSIRMSYLDAIEQGHLGKLISPIYAQGFIRKYASFLDLDGEQLIQEHPYVMQILQEKQPANAEYAFGIGSMEKRGNPGGDLKWLPNMLWVVLSVGVLLAGWFLARHFGWL